MQSEYQCTRRTSSASSWTRCAAGLLGVLVTSIAFATEINLYVVSPDGPTEFAAMEIEAAAKQRGHKIARVGVERFSTRDRTNIVLASTADLPRLQSLGMTPPTQPPSLKQEGFGIRSVENKESSLIWVIGADTGGTMYGGLELAEQIRLRDLDEIETMDRNPYMSMRGTKFNIPLDVRTPSYSDMSDAGQANIEHMWSFDFWADYLDALARHRYNYVSLWNLHPFPSLVKVPEYPDVALTDVRRSRIAFEEDYPTIATGLVTREMLANTETIRRLSIEDKIEFWRRVMRYAKDRNIDFYIITWNVFTYGVDGKYGITDALDNERTVDYFRASVRELFRTYPLLRGIGLTTGENMPDEDFQAKEDWAFATYGQGVLDVAREQPERQIRFIHRQHQTRAQDIAKTFAPLIKQPNVDFIFSFKYAQAHALSSTRQTFHHGYVESLGNLKTIWTLRNDDALLFRWGAPDFVREFVKNIPYEPSQGYYLGSDMWVWGRDFLSLDARKPRALEIDRHWYHWMLWGRLGYDPTLDNQRLIGLIHERYPTADAKRMFDTWQHASMIYPLTTGFHWADFDFQWYIEGSRSRPGPAQTESGFHDVNRFITLGTHPGTENIAISRYVDALLQKEKLEGTTPPEVARRIDVHADAALEGLRSLNRRPTGSPELADTFSDIRAMALLGKYYAAKIRGATALALYRRTGEVTHQKESISELKLAQKHWTEYTKLAASKYKNPLWTNRVGYVDWNELNAEVAKDVEIARQPRTTQ
jgi:hypothetical protein